MFFIDLFISKVMTRSRKERFAYSRSIPFKRLLILMAGAFLLFAAIGLQASLIGTRSPRIVNGVAWAIFSGVLGTSYLFVLSRKPILILVLIPGQILGNLALSWLLIMTARSHPAIAMQDVVRVYAPLTIVLTVVAYSLFYTFINVEGRFAFRAQTELALAHGIQKTLAPTIHILLAGCEFYGISVPSDKVGGDLVDVVALDDGQAIAYIADIAGHGLQAGILMGMVKAAFRTRLLDSPALPSLFDRLNRVLPGVKEANMYATSVALLFRPIEEGCTIEYALAGHPPILHLSGRGYPPVLLADEQFPLGLMPIATYRSHTTQAFRGDLIVVMTDGVLEVFDNKGAEFGIDRLQSLAIADLAEALPSLARRILDTVHGWGSQEDDQTLLLVRVL